jgi:tetratricopeptide (TPR) repeat protein
MGLGLIVALLTSAIRLPPYYRAAVLLKEAETLSENGQDRKAIGFFQKALEITPTAKRARMGIALAYFTSTDEDDHKRGLLALEGLTVGKDDWQKLVAVMPPEYQRYFTRK